MAVCPRPIGTAQCACTTLTGPIQPIEDHRPHCGTAARIPAQPPALRAGKIMQVPWHHRVIYGSHDDAAMRPRPIGTAYCAYTTLAGPIHPIEDLITLAWYHMQLCL